MGEVLPFPSGGQRFVKVENKTLEQICKGCAGVKCRSLCTEWTRRNDKRCRISKNILWSLDDITVEIDRERDVEVYFKNEQGINVCMVVVGNVEDGIDLSGSKDEFLQKYFDTLTSEIYQFGFNIIFMD